MSMTQGYDLMARAMADMKAILSDESIPDQAKVSWGRAVITDFDRERENMIREHEDYRREINGPR